ncbi:5'/3'-nucleotidase SurE [Microbulbifer spongiae]|uniref:5'-nucleotidase n=1 Tax=Microbulbifer spongiae TaxID=2944933 RepID=A0ABY9EBR8_9GAMM|nr:5'/3'-nucleotidase SurE [Microbulbifer sp. MI-G]WKD48959.1 5'/3'-nucleotidase SurE [Microbulbifer sp. MI-G]
MNKLIQLTAIVMVVMTVSTGSNSVGHTLPEPLNILLVNDDGFTSENTSALYDLLTEQGHNVIVSLPAQNQSGKSSSIALLRPILPVFDDTGTPIMPPIGSRDDDPHYTFVNGTPVMAMLRGIDILAPIFFGAKPDIVISGPNKGNNLGVFTVNSGTVGAAIAAAQRGIPAIAVSASHDDGEGEVEKIAILTNKVLAAVQDYGKEPLLPIGMALNVNFPSLKNVDINDIEFAATVVGNTAPFVLSFYDDLANSPIAQEAAGGALDGFAGLSVDVPSVIDMPAEEDDDAETLLHQQGFVTTSAIQPTYAAGRTEKLIVRRILSHGLD